MSSYVKSGILCVLRSIIFQSRSYTCHIRLFLSFESNTLSVTAVHQGCVNESLGQSQELIYELIYELICELIYIYIVFMVKNLSFHHLCTQIVS